MEKWSARLFWMGFILLCVVGRTHANAIPLFRHIQLASWMDYRPLGSPSVIPRGSAHQRAMTNYADEMHAAAQREGIDWSYLMALTILECSGMKPCGHRFEPRRFRQLKQVRDGKRGHWDGVRKPDLVGKSDAEIRQLATSWGPFQIMGYHTITMSKHGDTVTVADLINEHAVSVGVRWVASSYPQVLAKAAYKDAFHIHNTGRPYPKIGDPKTFDPEYVSNGLAHMAYFQKQLPTTTERPVAISIPLPDTLSKTLDE